MDTHQTVTLSRFRLSSPRTYVPLILVGVLFVIPVVTHDPIFLHLMILIFFYAYLTLSWNIVGGFAGQVSLGHTAFTGIGAYTSTLLFIQLGLTPWIGMFAGGFLAALVAVLIGYPCFKLRGAYFALSTIGFLEALRIIVENTNEVFGIPIKGAQGMEVPLLGQSLLNFQFLDKEYYYYVILIMMFIALWITYGVSKSKFGYYLIAIKNDIDAAESLGVNVARAKLKAAALSGFLTAIGGTFYAQLILFIDPANIIGAYLSFEIVFIAVIGGRGTLLGPILGAFLLVPVSELTRVYLGGTYFGVHLIVFGGILMGVMLFLPRGINDSVLKIYNFLMHKLEKKRPPLELHNGTARD
jgi:branched-chain amino acid transport system permease protein